MANSFGRKYDGLTLIPWQGGKPLTRDITMVSTLAASYLHRSSHRAGGAAELVASRKEAKYAFLYSKESSFQPIALETLASWI